MKEDIKDRIKAFVFCVFSALALIYSGITLFMHTHEFYLGLVPIIIVLLMMLLFCGFGIKDAIYPDSLLGDCVHVQNKLWDKIKDIIEKEHPEIFEEYKNNKDKEDNNDER